MFVPSRRRGLRHGRGAISELFCNHVEIMDKRTGLKYADEGRRSPPVTEATLIFLVCYDFIAKEPSMKTLLSVSFVLGMLFAGTPLPAPRHGR